MLDTIDTNCVSFLLMQAEIKRRAPFFSDGIFIVGNGWVSACSSWKRLCFSLLFMRFFFNVLVLSLLTSVFRSGFVI